MRILKQLLVVLACSITLSGCGFHLAGQYDVPEEMRKVNLQIGSNERSGLRQPLLNLLKVNRIKIRDDAPYRLEILKEDTRRRSLSLQLDGDTVEYERIMTASFRVFSTADNTLVLGEREVEARRVFDRIENTTASDAHDEQISEELYRQLAQKIVRQYLAIGRHQED